MGVKQDERIQNAAQAGQTFIPVWKTWSADLDTPVSSWLQIAGRSSCNLLLESVDAGSQLGRWSVVASDPLWVLESRGSRSVRRWRDGRCDHYEGNPLHLLRRLVAPYRAGSVPGRPALGQLFGMWGYEVIRWVEPTVPVHPADEGSPPDGAWMLCDSLLIFDQMHRLMTAVAYVNLQDDANLQQAVARANGALAALEACMGAPRQGRPLAWSNTAADAVPTDANRSAEDFEAAVGRAKQHILAGDVFQLVLSQRLQTEVTHAPFDVYRSLRLVNPSPYMAFFDFGDLQLIGSSPEVMVKVELNGADRRKACLRPIAGTRRRSDDPATDAALAEELLADPKERAEHVMLVDLARNDLGRICRPGSVKLTDLMVIERYSHVMHIVSEVEAELRDNCDALDVLMACFPAGTVSGAPKIRAMQLLHTLEPDRRGPYAGVYGSMDLQGSLNTAITIRTLVCRRAGEGRWQLAIQAGAGIVADSQPRQEYEETLNKARGMLKALSCLNHHHTAP